ncbi:MAG: hemerythrin domain-containing protein [Planctomycetes bacterium]|nr:hemerythrin domain-containing protein [Planctomycetota bacterium]
MKRCAELRDLSEDHHHALVLARRCERAAAGGDVTAAWEDATRRFAAELAPHFAAEERGLLPALRAAGEAVAAQRIEREHDALRAACAPGAPRDAAALAGFGRALAAHVRHEEREVFQRAQACLDAAALAAVAAARAAAPVRRLGCYST